MTLEFICKEESSLTHSAGDQEDWSVPQPSKFLTPLCGQSIEEVRQKLNAYLVSEVAKTNYGERIDGKPFDLLKEGEMRLGYQIAVRNGRYWVWAFEIVPYSDFLRQYSHQPGFSASV